MMENEETEEGETEEGRAMMRDELGGGEKLVQTCFLVCLFPWERVRRKGLYERDALILAREEMKYSHHLLS